MMIRKDWLEETQKHLNELLEDTDYRMTLSVGDNNQLNIDITLDNKYLADGWINEKDRGYKEATQSDPRESALLCLVQGVMLSVECLEGRLEQTKEFNEMVKSGIKELIEDRKKRFQND